MTLLDLPTELSSFASNKLIKDLLDVHFEVTTVIPQVFTEAEDLRKLELIKDIIIAMYPLEVTV